MCNTLVALPESTKSGNLIFAKNSDREPDEAQGIILLPKLENTHAMTPSHGMSDNNTLQCTYISIPQVEVTFEVMLSKPFQMWDAEMGINGFVRIIKKGRRNFGLWSSNCKVSF
ncbi:hypothetical protein [Aquiflexum sp.]|uniref:hypothetical protein n=1 Tax=Aquiflexum sp. TaxID=1872584 RepID=UPI003592E857